MTADVPRQPTVHDINIATVRVLVRAGVCGPCHRRWNEMRRVAADLGIRPEDAVYRAHDGDWKHRTDLDEPDTADHIREATVR